MAPKRGRRIVKTTKFVEETVEVSILGTQSQEELLQEAQAQPSASTKVSEHRDEQTTVTTKTVPIEDDVEEDEDQIQAQDETQETETQEPEFPLEEPKFYKVATPPREEAPPRQEGQAQDKTESRPKKRVKKEEASAQSSKAQGNKSNKKVGRKKGKRMKQMGEGREGYKRYVFRVLKQVHPGMAVSARAMTVINNLMTDMFERLAEEAARLNMHGGKHTLTAREIQGAVKLVLPGELGKHAIAEGTKAVTNYMTYDHK